MVGNSSLSTAQRVAKILLEIKAVTLSPNKPYKFVSGIISPIYTDNRLLMGYPLKRKEITFYLSHLIDENKLDFEVIAGTSTAGIPPAGWLAELLNLPMVYVRGEKKDHGKGKLVEGVMKKGAKVLLIEDLISTGKSSLSAIDTIREEGGKINTCLAFLDYGFKDTSKKYKQKSINLFTLTNLDELVDEAMSLKLIGSKEKEVILKWRDDPWNWAEKNKLDEKPKSVDY
ncbi:orotate phosphoribosyltransferase [Candidatus Daviesbacteria bacterium]|nr:orotate phosphoribosyltransferase [Candidatus Daviesbacteria bacterium]